MKKRRNKRYRPRDIRAPMIVGTASVFAAPMKLLADIRHSYVLEINRTVMLTSLDESEIYEAGETLRLMARVIGEFAYLCGETVDTTPIVQLANRLEYDMPIDDAALTPVERLFEQGQAWGNRLTAAQALAVLRGEVEMAAA